MVRQLSSEARAAAATAVRVAKAEESENCRLTTELAMVNEAIARHEQWGRGGAGGKGKGKGKGKGMGKGKHRRYQSRRLAGYMI